MQRFIIGLFVFLLVAMMAAAQETTPEPEITPELTAEVTAEATEDPACPTLVQTAITLTGENCDTTGLNEACYGYILINPEARPGEEENFSFNVPGDRVDILQIESVQLSAMDVASAQWGVIVFAVEANVEGEVSSTEDVQIVLFGDTRLEDASRFVQVTATGDVNVRALPNTDAAVVGSLVTGEVAVANARLEGDAWLRVRFLNSDSGLGWVSADYLEPASDISVMPVLSAEEAAAPVPDDLSAQYGPMQAFFFESGTNDSPCAAAPNSGMLIQTPDGVANVTIWLDEVVIQLDGTAFVQADAGGEMRVDVLEGTAQVEANDESSTAVAGQSVTVELDEDLGAVGTPSEPQATDPDDVQALPTVLLDDTVEVPDPLTQPAGVPIEGTYSFSFGVESLTCPDGEVVTFVAGGENASISFQDGAIIVSGLRYAEVSPGVYFASYQDSIGLHQDTLEVVSSDRILGDKTLDLLDNDCTLNVPFSYQLLAGN